VRRLFLEEVVARFRDRAVLAVLNRLLFGGEFRGPVGIGVSAGGDQQFVLEALGVAARVLPAFFGLFERPRRRLLAGTAADRPLGADQVRLPVVEEELGGGADLVDRPFGVGDVGEADRDLGLAEARDLGLGDAELVDPFADDLDRRVDVAARDFLGLAGRRRLVDELHPALEVEPEAGRLGRDDQGREQHQAQHE
jgi:hypothetical protein